MNLKIKAIMNLASQIKNLVQITFQKVFKD